jgi:hypothetical protein
MILISEEPGELCGRDNRENYLLHVITAKLWREAEQ